MNDHDDSRWTERSPAKQDSANSQRGRLPQFGMRGLLLFTTGLCVMFAVLAALGIQYWEMLWGILATSAVSLVMILLLELYLHVESDRRGRQGALRRVPPRLGHRAMTRPDLRTVDLAEIDPSGIDFVEPAGIAYLDDEDAPVNDAPPIMTDFADDKSTVDDS